MSKTSIIMLAHNCLDYTKECVRSIRENTKDYELIIVNNGSSDGTVVWGHSEKIEEESERLGITFWKIKDGVFIDLDENIGFAAGNNVGVNFASGDYICYLNNDTVLTPDWDRRLTDHIENGFDMVGPCTNFVAGRQRKTIEIYNNQETLNKASENFYQKNKGKSTETNWIIGYCMLMPISVVRKVGVFDERFGLGNSEDIDLCIRAKKEGLKIGIAEDVYIHHYGHVTFKGMSNGTTDLCANLVKTNREKLYKKWGEINYSQV